MCPRSATAKGTQGAEGMLRAGPSHPMGQFGGSRQLFTLQTLFLPYFSSVAHCR